MSSLPELLQSASNHLPTWLFWLSAVVGHAFLMTTGLNVLYAWPLPHKTLKLTRKVDVLLVLAGPILFAWGLDIFGTGRPDWEGASLRFYVAPYAVFCSVFGLVVAPACQVLYWMRRTAPHLVHEESTVIDVAQALGEAPVGRGKDHRLSRLPFNQVFQVEFRTLTLALPQLPTAWEGVTILHLTDLHLCGTPDRAFHDFVVKRAMEEGVPDLVAITGDVVDSSWHHRWIMPILGKLRWKLAGYAILGNHDSWRDTAQIRRRLRRIGLNVLGNGHHLLDVRGAPMLVVGHEGPWFGPAHDPSSWPQASFRLCLSHTPDNISWARQNAIDLMLAGHVHGGQVRLPVIGSVFCPSRYSRRFDCGTFFRAPTLMHVSRGLAGQHPLRYNCRPEVTRIILSGK